MGVVLVLVVVVVVDDIFVSENDVFPLVYPLGKKDGLQVHVGCRLLNGTHPQFTTFWRERMSVNSRRLDPKTAAGIFGFLFCSFRK